jgi:hypothetical protein
MATMIRLAYKAGIPQNDVADRVGGAPRGVTNAVWPLFEGKPMVHVVTLSRAHIVPVLPDRVAAVAVFISSLMDNEAWMPDTAHTKVLFLTHEDLKRDAASAVAPTSEPIAPGTILTHTREYTPGETDLHAAFNEPIGDEKGGGMSANDVAWAQHGDDLPDGHRVLFWFNENLVPGVNLGDMGCMYVTANEDATAACAWYQS